MQRRPTARTGLIAAAASAMLAGCVGGGEDYPSLAIRDFERVEGSFAVAPPQQVEPGPLPPEISARLPGLLAQAREAHEAFLALLPQAENLASRARGTSSDANVWAAAQVAAADLDSQRSRAAISLAELDRLFVDATLSFEERAAIGAVRDQVAGLIAEEDAALARLDALLPG